MSLRDLTPSLLCGPHLLGKHRELHALYALLGDDKRGYQQHPETGEWEGKLPAIYQAHQEVVVEMLKRNYKHASPIPFAPGKERQLTLLAPGAKSNKPDRGCGCKDAPKAKRRKSVQEDFEGKDTHTTKGLEIFDKRKRRKTT